MILNLKTLICYRISKICFTNGNFHWVWDRVDCYKEHSQFCQEIIDIENKIIRLRSPISNLQDSIPLLRIMPRWFNNSEIARMW